MSSNQTLTELGQEIHDNGMWEEFHQKKHNYTMYDYHKDRRLKLQKLYDSLKEKS